MTDSAVNIPRADVFVLRAFCDFSFCYFVGFEPIDHEGNTSSTAAEYPHSIGSCFPPKVTDLHQKIFILIDLYFVVQNYICMYEYEHDLLFRIYLLVTPLTPSPTWRDVSLM